MAVVEFSSVRTGETRVDNCLKEIIAAKTGKEAREPIIGAITRCHYWAYMFNGGQPANGATEQKLAEDSLSRIGNAVFGEDVRDAIRTGIILCYSARNKPIEKSPQGLAMVNMLGVATTGEEFKNAVLEVISRCCLDVMHS